MYRIRRPLTRPTGLEKGSIHPNRTPDVLEGISSAVSRARFRFRMLGTPLVSFTA